MSEVGSTGFLGAPPTTDAVQGLFDGDVDDRGFVMNLSRLWAHQPQAKGDLVAMVDRTAKAASLTRRDRAVLISAAASTLGDSYCSLAWGTTLADAADATVAGAVLAGNDESLDDRERALAGWARRVVGDPNGTAVEDVQQLRDVGFDDSQIFAVTLFVALRLAFSTVNDTLGVPPDRQLVDGAPGAVREAIRFGRSPA